MIQGLLDVGSVKGLLQGSVKVCCRDGLSKGCSRDW